MEKWNESDIKWIFAIHDNRVIEHYQRNYSGLHIPSEETLRMIVLPIIKKVGEVERMMDLLLMNKSLKEILGGDTRPTLDEWLWYGIQTYVTYLQVDKINELSVNNWKDIVEHERKEYDLLKDKTEELTADFVDYDEVEKNIIDVATAEKDKWKAIGSIKENMFISSLKEQTVAFSKETIKEACPKIHEMEERFIKRASIIAGKIWRDLQWKIRKINSGIKI